eukprot:scaffold49019_cov63-Phaeocystis_antarctica.AAC.1
MARTPWSFARPFIRGQQPLLRVHVLDIAVSGRSEHCHGGKDGHAKQAHFRAGCACVTDAEMRSRALLA